MTTYRERRLNKAARLQAWADKRREQAEATLEADRKQYGGDIAFATQPGHIPERARMIARTERAFESLQKADEMERRAAEIEGQAERSIYSDDADAIERLKERIHDLEAKRERLKEYNKTARKGSPDFSLLTEKERAWVEGQQRYLPGDYSHPISNLTADIRRNKARLQQVQGQPTHVPCSSCNNELGCPKCHWTGKIPAR